MFSALFILSGPIINMCDNLASSLICISFPVSTFLPKELSIRYGDGFFFLSPNFNPFVSPIDSLKTGFPRTNILIHTYA